MMEWRDLYDRWRFPLGTKAARGEPLPPGAFTLCARVWILGTDGRFCIQKRAAKKTRWPGYWDCSAAGGVQTGESTREAALRETGEELGIALVADALEHVYTLTDGQRYDDVYLARLAEIPSPKRQREEVASVRWANRDEIIALVGEGRFLPYEGLSFLFGQAESPWALLLTAATRPGAWEYQVTRNGKSAGCVTVDRTVRGVTLVRAAKAGSADWLLPRLEAMFPYDDAWRIAGDIKNPPGWVAEGKRNLFRIIQARHL